MTERTATRSRTRGTGDSAAAGFERLYRANVEAVTAPDQVGELLDRIDAERVGRDLVTGLSLLSDRDRALVELVDLAGLRPKEAAAVLGLTPGAVRMRLMRARARLRKQVTTTNQIGSEDDD